MTNWFSNLDFLQKSGFPKTLDLSKNLGNVKNIENLHFVIKRLPFFCLFWAPTGGGGGGGRKPQEHP